MVSKKRFKINEYANLKYIKFLLKKKNEIIIG